MTALFPPINMSTRLEASNISISRGDSVLFEYLTVTVSARDVLWIHGDNGIGKTTLLEIFAGLSRPDAGHISWLNGETSTTSNQLIAYQPHNSFAKANLTALEDLTFWANLSRSADLVNLALGYVDLTAKQSVNTQNLSAGQRRRLALAKLIISRKPVWIMDEPGAAMDKGGVALIEDLIKKHIARGGTAIVASHDVSRKLSANTRTLSLKAVS